MAGLYGVQTPLKHNYKKSTLKVKDVQASELQRGPMCQNACVLSPVMGHLRLALLFKNNGHRASCLVGTLLLSRKQSLSWAPLHGTASMHVDHHMRRFILGGSASQGHIW